MMKFLWNIWLSENQILSCIRLNMLFTSRMWILFKCRKCMPFSKWLPFFPLVFLTTWVIQNYFLGKHLRYSLIVDLILLHRHWKCWLTYITYEKRNRRYQTNGSFQHQSTSVLEFCNVYILQTDDVIHKLLFRDWKLEIKHTVHSF